MSGQNQTNEQLDTVTINEKFSKFATHSFTHEANRFVISRALQSQKWQLIGTGLAV